VKRRGHYGKRIEVFSGVAALKALDIFRNG